MVRLAMLSAVRHPDEESLPKEYINRINMMYKTRNACPEYKKKRQKKGERGKKTRSNDMHKSNNG